MRNISFSIVIISIFSIFLSCSDNKKDPDYYLNEAKTLMNSHKYQLAKKSIDSIQILFPEKYSKIREGIRVMHEINYQEQKRTYLFCDSLLRIKQTEFKDLSKNFAYEKNAKYESMGHYIYKTQLLKNNYHRSFLQTKVNENGRLILTSYYCGRKKINHNYIKVMNKHALFAETKRIDSKNSSSYSFFDGEYHFEMVQFRRRSENGIINFILSNINGILMVMPNGNRKYMYYLTKGDKTAIKETKELSTVLSDINKLNDEIKLAKAKIKYLDKYLNK